MMGRFRPHPGEAIMTRRRRTGVEAVLSLLGAVRVYVAVPPADLRKGYDGLAQLARDVIDQDPLSGHLFVFANRKHDRIKILYWDRDGYAVWMKRLERG